MKKRVIGILFIVSILFIAFVIAQDNGTNNGLSSGDAEGAKVDKAYQCLENEIETKNSFSIQDAVFGLLAFGSNQKLESELEKQRRSGDACWPKSGCNIKDTAQVLLVYNKIGKDIEDIKKWLISKAQSAKDLVWFLEIDIQNHGASECTLRYDSRDFKINVKDDMTLSGNPGNCFEISYGGYWLKLKESCLDKEFEISCNRDFITTLVYQKKSGGTVYVSSNTHSSASLGTTNEKVNSKCFALGSSCDYEGTLWAATALKKINEETSVYIPYLLAMADSNQKYLPSAFLYILTGGEDQYSELIQKQKQGQYWDIVGSPYNRFYDTSLALLALNGAGAVEFDSAKDYLLAIQPKEGCWNNKNIRDTAFILYAGWPKTVFGGGGVIDGGDSEPFCERAGNFCEPSDECINAGGDVLGQFVCPNFRDSCCSVRVLEQTCDEKGGLVCSTNQECNGRLESSASGSCCLEGACIEKKEENICETIGGGICRSACFDDEKQASESCPDTGDLCCVSSGISEPEEPRKNYWWIVILIILILLVIIAILYRHKIQAWAYNRRNRRAREGRTGLSRGPPPGFGGPLASRPMPRYGVPGQQTPARAGPALRVTRGAKSQEDKELEETMKKLKEISK